MAQGAHWYPGHMTKARKVIADAMSSTDVVLEVLDARMPHASGNPVMEELRGQKPCLKVLAKGDLADPDVTRAWVAHLEARDPSGRVRALALSKDRPGETRARVAEIAQGLAPHRTGIKPLRALVVGIPNVGKSTLINVLMERKVAKTGDRPAVTKAQQRVVLKSGMVLSDNPGILWPTLTGERALVLALGGAIPETALDYESVGLFAAKVLLARYPRVLAETYRLDPLPDAPLDVLEAAGRRHGALRKGGVVDWHRAAEALVHAFRSGALGRISLEAPESPR